MAASSVTVTYNFGQKTLLARKPISKTIPSSVLTSSTATYLKKKRWNVLRLVMVKKTEKDHKLQEETNTERWTVITPRVLQRLERKRSERNTYLVAAVMSSLGVTSAAAMAVYYRFSWQTEVMKIN